MSKGSFRGLVFGIIWGILGLTAVSAFNPPQGGVSPGSDAVLGDVTADTVVLDSANADVALARDGAAGILKLYDPTASANSTLRVYDADESNYVSLEHTGGYAALRVDGTIVQTLSAGSTTNAVVTLNHSGSAGVPAWGFNSDNDGTGTGLFRIGADQLGISSNGIQRYAFGGTFALNANGYIQSNNHFGFGTNSPTKIGYETLNGHLMVQTDTTTNTILVIESGDAATDFGASDATNPTIRIQSADETSPTEFVSLSHDQTDAVLDTGSGSLLVKFGGIERMRVGAATTSFDSTTLIKDNRIFGFGNTGDVVLSGNETDATLQIGSANDLTDGTLETGSVGLGDGTAAAPSLFFTSDDDGTGTGAARTAADTFAIVANGNARFTVSPSTTTSTQTMNQTGGLFRVYDNVPFVYGTGTDMKASGETTTLGAETATRVLSVTMSDGVYASLEIKGCIRATDGTDASVETFTVQIALIDRSGGVAASAPGVVSVIVDTGSSVLTQGVWTVTTTDDGSIEINVASVVTGITQTTHEVSWVATYSGNAAITVP